MSLSHFATTLCSLILAISSMAHAAPACDDADVACLTAKLKTARVHKAQVKAHKALAKAQQKAWIADCIAERTGPVGGISVAEARDICQAEVPSLNELRTDPTAAPSIQACGQRLTDACVAHAKRDGSTDCRLEGALAAAYRQGCLGR